jgi:4-amino-4-deoxy-L-arabinose transferase-like glycosyltransferase
MRWLKTYRIWVILLFLGVLRIFHLGEAVDKPHSWRQFDTLQYIEGYYYDEAPFLEPSVCWMGGHKTLILEFPLPEYLVAKLYSVFGPHLLVARLFFLFFFLLSAYFLFKSLKVVFSDSRVPELATLIYGILPLSLYYSRAIHIDFFVFAFAFGALYFALRAIQERRLYFLLLSCALTCVGFVVKAPYFFFLIPPILVFAVQRKALRWLSWRAMLFSVPLFLLFLWTVYTKTVNGRVPDWSVIPNFNRFTEMWYWYFGIWEQRMHPGNWLVIGERIFYEIFGWTGALLGLLGLVILRKSKEGWWTLSLLFGSVLYLLVFFNLNFIHNYYQLPFVLVAAVLSAMGIEYLVQRLPQNSISVKNALVATACVLLFVESLTFAERNYYTEDTEFARIANEIRKHTSREDLVIVCHGGLTPQCPLILQPAGRYGWSIPLHDVTPAMIYALYRDAGASHLAVVHSGYFGGEFQIFFEAMEDKIGIPLDDKGMALYMCRLKM